MLIDIAQHFELDSMKMALHYKKDLIKKAPEHAKILKHFKKVQNSTSAAIEDWTQTPNVFMPSIQAIWRKWRKLPPLERKQQEKSFEWIQVSAEEKKSLESNAKLLRILRITAIAVGTILVGIGILGPLGLSGLLLFAPETFATTFITTCTVAGLIGVIPLLAHFYLANYDGAERKLRARTDKEFQKFMKTHVEQRAQYCFSEAESREKGIHITYLSWHKEMKELFTPEVIKKLSEEKKNLGFPT